MNRNRDRDRTRNTFRVTVRGDHTQRHFLELPVQGTKNQEPGRATVRGQVLARLASLAGLAATKCRHNGQHLPIRLAL